MAAVLLAVFIRFSRGLFIFVHLGTGIPLEIVYGHSRLSWRIREIHFLLSFWTFHDAERLLSPYSSVSSRVYRAAIFHL